MVGLCPVETPTATLLRECATRLAADQGIASDEPVKAGADLRSLKDWITIIEVQCERTVPLEFLDLEFTRFVNAVDKLKATKEASQALEPQLADIQRHHD
ncbi:hypothetical protein GN958_ATG04032 [Phytophthora infestans]|uniref:Uncharacterized protein n=1 Tax=Phytophthora infestans TaxID=4787 RepID=A0A8S9V8C0_PHYIN|nr:hypothetical protein GN958_ATG04032 [Phytophthora infestans]